MFFIKTYLIFVIVIKFIKIGELFLLKKITSKQIKNYAFYNINPLII